MEKQVNSDAAMQTFGERIGASLTDGMVVELIGDVGAGKTTFVKGLVRGAGSSEVVQSPTFTISRVYELGSGRSVRHYDFYRLQDAGIMLAEVAEAVGDDKTIVVVEWSAVIDDVLPADRLMITITTTNETQRQLVVTAGGNASRKIVEQLA